MAPVSPLSAAPRRLSRLVSIPLAALVLSAGACDRGAEGARSGGAPEVIPQPIRTAGLGVVQPEHETNERYFDLGELYYGDVVERTIALRNLEDRPLTIKQLVAGCSCTTPKVSYVGANGEVVHGDRNNKEGILVVPPNQEIELHLRVDTRYVPARNTIKRVLVQTVTDSELEPFLSLEISFVVEMPFQVVPATIRLGQVGIGAGARGKTDIVPIGATGVEIVDVLEAPENMLVELTPQSRVGSDYWELKVQLMPPLEPGHQTHVVRLRTTGPAGDGDGKPLEVKVEATGVDDVSVVPTRLVFPKADSPRPAVATIEILARAPGHVLRIVDTHLDGDRSGELEVVTTPARPDEEGRSNRWRIELKEPEGERPPLAGTLTVVLDDPQYPEFQIPYMRLN